MIQKFFTLFVITLFLLSSGSIVLAEEDKDDDKKRDGVKRLDADRMQDQVRGKLRDKTQLIDAKRVKTAKAKAVDRVKDVKKRHMDLAKERRKNLHDEAKRIRDHCKGTDKNTDCTHAIDQFKKHLKKTTARLAEAFGKIKARIENVDIDNKEPVLADIDSSLRDLKALDEKIDAATTRTDLKEIKENLRKLAKDYRDFIKQQRKHLFAKHARKLVNKADRVKTKLDKLATRLDGVDESKADTITKALAEVDAKLEAAKTAISSDNKDGVKAAFKDLQTLLKRVVTHFRNVGQKDQVHKELGIASVVGVEAVAVEPVQVAGGDV